MKAKEFITPEHEEFYEVKMVFARSKPTARGGSTSLKFRCTSGPRKSRTVATPAQCYDHPNVARAQQMKTTRARTKNQQARRQSRTKSINTATKLVQQLNKVRKVK